MTSLNLQILQEPLMELQKVKNTLFENTRSMSSRNSRILGLLNYRLKVILADGRTMVGTMLAFDRYLNLVLQEAMEFRTVGVKDKVLWYQRRSL